MSSQKSRSIEIPLATDRFEEANSFIEKRLRQDHISKEAILETDLVFEALFHDLIGQGFDQNVLLSIKPQRTFGEYVIKLGFEGKPYVPNEPVQEEIYPELKIVQAFNDKVDFSYRLGYNSIRIIVKRNYRGFLFYCVLGILLAILLYLPIRSFMGEGERQVLNQDFVFPMMQLFANAMLMVGAPLTFFSLIKNLADIYIVSEKSSSGRKLQVKTVVTSGISILLALGIGFLAAAFLSSQRGILSDSVAPTGEMSIAEFIGSMVPSNIFEPFQTYMPFPIIIVALMITYALCSIGKYFDLVQRAINVCFTLFSKMVKIVMFTLPFFCFLALLTSLLEDGFSSLFFLLQLILTVLGSLFVMVGFYLVRLLIGGVKIVPFLRHLPELLWENYKINSAIEAVSFNIRFCARKYGYNRKRLSEKLPILAETNQDGNCFLIMLISVIFIFLLGIEISWLHIVGITFLILFLSFGAPNQPGSIVIGMLIITFFLQAQELISIAIFSEVFFGALQNIINVAGDIVTVAIEERKAQAA